MLLFCTTIILFYVNVEVDDCVIVDQLNKLNILIRYI